MSKEKLDRDEVHARLSVAMREYQQANENFDRAVAEMLGLNATDARCMDFLMQHGRMTAGELAERSSLSPGAVTTVIDRLERAGYARRVRDDGDRRRVVVEITEEPAMLDVRRLMPRAQIVCGFIVARVADQDPAEPAAALRSVCELLRDGRLRLRVTVMGLDEAAEAHRLIEARRHIGKLVLTPRREGA